MSSPSRMSRPTSPFSGISEGTPQQSPKPEPPASQQVSPIQAASPSAGLSNDEQEIDLQTLLSERFPRFDAISIHKEYDDVAAKQTRFEEDIEGAFFSALLKLEAWSQARPASEHERQFTVLDEELTNVRIREAQQEKARQELWRFVCIIADGLKDFLSLGRMDVGLNSANLD